MMRRDEELKAEVIGDRLVISIGISALAAAAENSPMLQQYLYHAPDEHDTFSEYVKITDEYEFAKHVGHRLSRVNEDLDTPVMQCFDNTFCEMISDSHNGELGISIEHT